MMLDILAAAIVQANATLDWIEERQGPLKPDGFATIETTVGLVRALRGALAADTVTVDRASLVAHNLEKWEQIDALQRALAASGQRAAAQLRFYEDEVITHLQGALVAIAESDYSTADDLRSMALARYAESVRRVADSLAAAAPSDHECRVTTRSIPALEAERDALTDERDELRAACTQWATDSRVVLAAHDARVAQLAASEQRVAALVVLDDVYEWQRETFPSRTPASIAAHLLEEAGELAREPLSTEEMADVAMLLFALVRDTGADLAAALAEKLARNRLRDWSAPPNAQGYVKARKALAAAAPSAAAPGAAGTEARDGEDIDDIRYLAESYSGLQYVVTDPTKQWPWGSVPAVNEIVDIVRAMPDLLARSAAMETERGALRAALETAEQVIADVQFDLINCHQQNACAHIQDALMIVNRHGDALAAAAPSAGAEG